MSVCFTVRRTQSPQRVLREPPKSQRVIVTKSEETDLQAENAATDSGRHIDPQEVFLDLMDEPGNRLPDEQRPNRQRLLPG